MKTLQVMDSPVARRAVEVGKKHKRRFRPLAYADELEEPLFFNDWWFIPISEDDSIIPEEAKRRVNMLKAANIEVVDLIVAHETTRLLPPPPGESAADKRRAKWERRKKQIKDASKALSVAADVAIGALAGAVYVFGHILAFGLLLIDPALIAVVEDEDGTRVWIEVATWYD